MNIFSKIKNLFKPKNKPHNNQTNKKQPNKENQENQEEKPYEIKYTLNANGNMQIDFYDKKEHFANFYDTTRLIVSRQPLNIEGKPVYNCAVSWYGQNDMQMLNKKTGVFDSLRAQEYRGVLAELDIRQLQTNPNYCNAVMTSLLKQSRVEQYLERGMQENPKDGYPCGKYIGGIEKKEQGYRKIFDIEIGQASHNSELMKNRRKEYREMIEAKKRENIANKRKQIEKLQNEIEEMK